MMKEEKSIFGPDEKDRQDAELWGMAQESGVSRRNFLALMALGGAGAVLAACGKGDPTPTSIPSPTPTPEGPQIPIAQVPLPPVGARMVTTACDYCSVGCGYKVFTWPVGTAGGPNAADNAPQPGPYVRPAYFNSRARLTNFKRACFPTDAEARLAGPNPSLHFAAP